jgi:hypothetical protein
MDKLPVVPAFGTFVVRHFRNLFCCIPSSPQAVNACIPDRLRQKGIYIPDIPDPAASPDYPFSHVLHHIFCFIASAKDTASQSEHKIQPLPFEYVFSLKFHV